MSYEDEIGCIWELKIKRLVDRNSRDVSSIWRIFMDVSFFNGTSHEKISMKQILSCVRMDTPRNEVSTIAF